MNIFKILSDGDGSIKEPNVSAFLAYLLDPSQSHGLGSKFLEGFIHNLVFNSENQFEELKINNKIKDLSRSDKSGFYVEITTEKTVQLTNQKSRDIDILIEFYNNESNFPLYSICVENKIKDSSLNKIQLINEVLGIINEYEKEDISNQPRISMIFITPSFSEKSKKNYSEFLNQLNTEGLNITTNHLIWEHLNDNENSIFFLLSRILKNENEGLIDPIHEYTKFTIKSFLNFILTGFKSYQEEKNESGKFKRKRLSESEYWKFNRDSRLLGLAKEIKKYVCENYDVEVKYSPSHMSFYSNHVKGISKYGVFFQITINSKSKFDITLRKDKNIPSDIFFDSFKSLINVSNFNGKIKENTNQSLFNVIISNKNDFEQIGKPLINESYKFLTNN
jgi:hypothetical protein